MNDIIAAQQQALAQAQAQFQAQAQLMNQAVDQSLMDIWFMGLKMYLPLIVIFAVCCGLIFWKLSQIVTALREGAPRGGESQPQEARRPSLKHVW